MDIPEVGCCIAYCGCAFCGLKENDLLTLILFEYMCFDISICQVRLVWMNGGTM